MMVEVSNQLIRSRAPFATLPLISQTVWELQRNASKQIWGRTRILFSGLWLRVEFLCWWASMWKVQGCA